MTPLVDRLRAQADTFWDTRCELLHEAADEIERLQRCKWCGKKREGVEHTRFWGVIPTYLAICKICRDRLRAKRMLHD